MEGLALEPRDRPTGDGHKVASPRLQAVLAVEIEEDRPPQDRSCCDFFTVPTVTFRVLFVFIVQCHERRRVVHFHVTAHPTAEWSAQQIVEAFPADGTEPRYLIRDRDSIYGEYFRQRVKNMGIKEVVIAWRSPWQNPYCERVGGTLRRECLDHVIVLNETHLRRILVSFLDYYHASRPHQSLHRNAPTPRHIEPPSRGQVIAIPQVGGLHHRYCARCLASSRSSCVLVSLSPTCAK